MLKAILGSVLVTAAMMTASCVASDASDPTGSSIGSTPDDVMPARATSAMSARDALEPQFLCPGQCEKGHCAVGDSPIAGACPTNSVCCTAPAEADPPASDALSLEPKFICAGICIGGACETGGHPMGGACPIKGDTCCSRPPQP